MNMPRSSFQKLKIIYVMEYLLKYSDEEHPVTTNQIIAYLQSHDIAAERKSIYSDIESLRDYGLDINQDAIMSIIASAAGELEKEGGLHE